MVGRFLDWAWEIEMANGLSCRAMHLYLGFVKDESYAIGFGLVPGLTRWGLHLGRGDHLFFEAVAYGKAPVYMGRSSVKGAGFRTALHDDSILRVKH